MNEFKVKYSPFPDPLAPKAIKDTEEYGKKWSDAIQYEWFHKGGGECSFFSRQEKFHELRVYARGDQSTDIYKQLMAPGGESYTNYDWRPIQVVPKFVKLVVNQMTERLFEIQANATDPYSTSMRGAYRRKLEDLMASKEYLEKGRALQGIDLLPKENDAIPDSQEELELRMKLKYKQNAEIASETAIKFTLDLNDFEEVQSNVIEDIATIGIGATKTYTDIHKGVVVEEVDPAKLVYSHPKHRDFRDVYYYGEVERITIGELRREMRAAGKELSEDEYEALGDGARSWAKYHGMSSENKGDIEGMMVDVLRFTFKANNKTVYKKKYNKNGGYKLIQKDESFEKAPDHIGYDVVKKDREVWYEGSRILGTDIVFDYGPATNMVREKGQLNRVIPKYSVYAPEIYEGKVKSLVGRVIQYVDLMQQVHIKIQQMVAKARPSGVYIDVDGLSEIPLGDGKSLTPLEAIKIYDETGNVIGTSQGSDGAYNYGKQPIVELKNGIVEGVERLVNVYNTYLNQLRDAIGIPQGMDASMPHPDTLVGVQEQVALNSNTATRHILHSVLHITKRTATSVSLRLKDIFKHSNLKDFYINAIGKTNVDILESLKNYHLHDFSIMIELKPDAEQKQQLERNIQIALERQEITLDDAIDVRQVGNMKLANELLKIRRQKREEAKKNHEKEMVKINAEENAKAAERASQAKQQELQVETQSKVQIETVKGENAIRKIQAEEQSKARLMEKEFQYNMTLRGIDEEFKAQERKENTELQGKLEAKKGTQASMLQHQKERGGAPVNFESSEDNISGSVEMGELEPS